MWTQRLSGQTHQRGSQDHRDPYERDSTRVIHCPSFRRLQRKTQILGTDEGDFHRTRLTHSLEVASIGRSIVRNLSKTGTDDAIRALLPNDDLIHVVCLLHDIGHPPFGHGGEVALNYMMRHHGGFEGNGQTLRLLTKLETSYGQYGLDLTRRSLLGILKYPVPRSRVAAPEQAEPLPTLNKTIRVNDWLPPKAYFDSEEDIIQWVLSPFVASDKTLFQSLQHAPMKRTHGKAAYHALDCSIMDVADNIAYGVHDLEDAIHLGLIGREQLDNEAFNALLNNSPLASTKHTLLSQLFSNAIDSRKQAIGELVNYFITSVRTVVTHPSFEAPFLKYNVALTPEADALVHYLIRCIYEHVIDSQEARTFEYGGQTVVLRLFEAMSSNPTSLLDNKNRALYNSATDEMQAMRIICDYIASMTDEYAYRMHERLFGFNTRTIFERL